MIVEPPAVVDVPDTAAKPRLSPETDRVRQAPTPSVFNQRVAVILSGRQPAYENVARKLETMLGDYSVYDLSDRSQPVRSVFRSVADEQATAVVAIGLRAALSARALSQVPVVFCQVFNVADNDLITDRVRGVASLPPLDLQFRAWKELDPGLRHVGAIIGPGHESLIDEASRAATESGLQLHIRVAASDKETLYIFNRLVRDVDGFLLFPDNRILSHGVLDEMLSGATRHRVQMAVFNDSLLSMGATLSASAVDTDVAATIVRVLDSIGNRELDALPAVTPLSSIEIRTNKEVVQQFGLGGDAAAQDTIAGAM
ncbi:MAG: ABC transporter substrate-binding protein [Woeseiaceae bacterium]